MHRAPTLNSLTSSLKMIILQKQDKFKDGEQNKKINMNSLCLLPSSIHNRILNAKEYSRPHTHDQVIFLIQGESCGLLSHHLHSQYHLQVKENW